MAILDLVLYPDDPLKRVAEPYETFGPDLPRLAEDMLETMYAYEGVGLAGPQVGLAKRIFVMHEPDGRALCLVNPEILEAEGREDGEEGCLSLPQVYAMVPRATRIRVRACDQFGTEREFEATGYQARIIQHEHDHLEGIIFPDRLDILSREAILQEWAQVRAKLHAKQGSTP
jgi:peptide deformylase